MIKYSIDRDSTGAVLITVESLLGVHPIMWFNTWDMFMQFYNDMTELVKANRTPIPDVYIEGLGLNEADL